MTESSNRRGFLRGLTTLPLIGGGVTLIGSPTGAATTGTTECLKTYITWLHYEQRAVHDYLWPEAAGRGQYIPLDNPGASFHFHDLAGLRDWPRVGQEAAFRAPVVLSTVGCDWRK
ncbi:hypothetical protein Q8W71_13825 [Methylobacterium sp. NEAU 140]|uniref:hypothetical protein n=1 Tax=Methylobacterium sp. NEAU 140 TaxID=3064945 RepID=UPI002736674A|nr:hypothetical protein [Methylobacterium sp. NEAU 140]MDP4023710.1 hypothetical protein [Methylobacterium sp. NEAU 140]